MEFLKSRLIVIFIAISYQVTDVVSRNTFQCPTKCLCISGDTGDGQVCSILDEQEISDAWMRFRRTIVNESTIIYLCRNEELDQIEQDMMSDPTALFLDGNSIRILDTTDHGNVNNASFPTLMLSLYDNKIKKITTSFLRRLPYLKVIILRNNLLDNLRWTKGQESMFPDLLEFDVSRNTLTTLTLEDIGAFPSLIR